MRRGRRSRPITPAEASAGLRPQTCMHVNASRPEAETGMFCARINLQPSCKWWYTSEYRRDTRKWGSALGIGRGPIVARLKSRGGRVPKPGSAARNATPSFNHRRGEATQRDCPAAAPEREDMDLVGELPEEEDDSPQKRSKAVRADVPLWEALMVCLEDVPSNAKLHGKRGAPYIGGYVCMHACHGCGSAAADKTVVHGRGRRSRRGGCGGRMVRASSDSDGDEERDAAELDSAIAEGGLEEVLPSDGAESEGHDPGSGSADDDDDADADDAPADDRGDDDDGADVGQLTAIAQRLARDQRAQCARV
eukprot:96162-Chlamydomonas_euryale.AAC.3